MHRFQNGRNRVELATAINVQKDRKLAIHGPRLDSQRVAGLGDFGPAVRLGPQSRLVGVPLPGQEFPPTRPHPVGATHAPPNPLR